MWKHTDAGEPLYISPQLDRLWKLGNCSIGEVTFESAAYVARYAVKKVTGDMAQEHYLRCDEFGEAFWLPPEYVTMSRGGRGGKGGIAREWFQRFGNEVYPFDEVISRGVPSKPPRFYDSLLERSDPVLLESVKRKRMSKAKRKALDNTPERLAVRETCAKARVDLFKRALDK